MAEMGSNPSLMLKPSCNNVHPKAGVVSNVGFAAVQANPMPAAPPAPSDVTPPTPITPAVVQNEASRWLKAESERAEWRRAHKVVEWDGWEEGLVAEILGEVDIPTQPTSSVNSAPSQAPGVGTFRGVGFGAGSALGDRAIFQFYETG